MRTPTYFEFIVHHFLIPDLMHNLGKETHIKALLTMRRGRMETLQRRRLCCVLYSCKQNQLVSSADAGRKTSLGIHKKMRTLLEPDHYY